MEIKTVKIKPVYRPKDHGTFKRADICRRSIKLTLDDEKIEFTSKSERKYLKHMYNSLLNLWFLCRSSNISLQSCGCCNSILVKDFSKNAQPAINYPISDLYITPTEIEFTSKWYEEE